MTSKKELIRQYDQENRLVTRGLSHSEAETLRKCSLAISRWAERECNGDVEVDEATGKAYAMSNPQYGKYRRLYQTANRGAGAERRALAIINSCPNLAIYFQTDPRGVAIYVYSLSDPRLKYSSIDSGYSTIGTAVY